MSWIIKYFHKEAGDDVNEIQVCFDGDGLESKEIAKVNRDNPLLCEEALRLLLVAVQEQDKALRDSRT